MYINDNLLIFSGSWVVKIENICYTFVVSVEGLAETTQCWIGMHLQEEKSLSILKWCQAEEFYYYIALKLSLNVTGIVLIWNVTGELFISWYTVHFPEAD